MCFRLPKVNISGFVRNDSSHRFSDIYSAFLCKCRHSGCVKVLQQIESLHFNHHRQNRRNTTDTVAYTNNWQQQAKARRRKSNRRLVTLPATAPMRHTYIHTNQVWIWGEYKFKIYSHIVKRISVQRNCIWIFHFHRSSNINHYLLTHIHTFMCYTVHLVVCMDTHSFLHQSFVFLTVSHLCFFVYGGHTQGHTGVSIVCFSLHLAALSVIIWIITGYLKLIGNWLLICKMTLNNGLEKQKID